MPDIHNCFDVNRSAKPSRLIRAQSINATKGLPFPSVLSQWREGIPFPFCLLSAQGGNPLLFLLIMTLLFAPQEHWKVLFFFPCFPFSHKRVKCSPSFPSSLSEVKRDSFACYFLQTLTVLVFCFNISG